MRWMEFVQRAVSMWVCRSCGITCHCHQMSHSCSVATEFNNTEFKTSLPMCCLCSTVFRCVHWSYISPDLVIGNTQVLQLWFTQTPIIFTIWSLILVCSPLALSILMHVLFSLCIFPYLLSLMIMQ
jgi:hypothetical protein